MTSLRATFPSLCDVAVQVRKPSIALNVPDSLFDFVEKLRCNGLKVDNEPFTWDGHEYWLEPYKAMRVTGDRNDEGFEFSVIKGAQVGATIFGFLALVWLALRWYGKYFGYFLPDREMAMDFSDVRFKPMCMGIPELRELWGEDPTADWEDNDAADRKSVRSIGASRIFWKYMQGKTSTESIPMLGLIFDEVRRMLMGDIERAAERISHSPYPINIKYSTAGYPESDIDHYFRKGWQSKFHSKCRCGDGVLLADLFPESIGEALPGVTPSLAGLGRYFWVCPKCKEPVPRPVVGQWLKHAVDHPHPSFHIPQTLSPRQTASSIFKAYNEAKDIQEFFQSKLGRPYIAKDALLVNEAILEATVNPALRWLEGGKNFAMGIDQMGGFNVVVIRTLGERSETGFRKSRLVWLAWIEEADPWEECERLMYRYDISICVADSGPNINEARRFAAKFPGRVFLADYSFEAEDGTADLCEWGDRPRQNAKQKQASEETKNLWRVRIDRYKAIEWNLMRYVHRLKEQPAELLPAEIEGKVRGVKQTIDLCRKLFWVHLQKVARRVVPVYKTIREGGVTRQVDEGRTRQIFENIGLDPHFLHADLYCEFALTRVSDGGGAFGDFKPEPGAGQQALFTCARCGVTLVGPDGQPATDGTKSLCPFCEKASKKGEHDWQPLATAGQYRCAACGVSLVARDGDPQAVAAKAGLGECRGAK